jgi:predicted glutamine amidotransferase
VCELFALSGDKPANVTFSLGVFGERGGRLGLHRDGWGIAFKEERDFRVVKEAAPAAASACLRFIESNEIRSDIVLSHLRLASVPWVTSYTNTHPFSRELFGACHVFAHNGTVPGVMRDPRMAPTWNFPFGQTDSERAFCTLMDRLRGALAPTEVLNLSKKLPIIQGWARELAHHGTANFLLSDSEYLYAHRSTQLFYVERQCRDASETFGSDSLRVDLVGEPDGARHVSLVATQSRRWRVSAFGSLVRLVGKSHRALYPRRRTCSGRSSLCTQCQGFTPPRTSLSS